MLSETAPCSFALEVLDGVVLHLLDASSSSAVKLQRASLFSELANMIIRKGLGTTMTTIATTAAIIIASAMLMMTTTTTMTTVVYAQTLPENMTATTTTTNQNCNRGV
jgi:hypothetical protein